MWTSPEVRMGWGKAALYLQIPKWYKYVWWEHCQTCSRFLTGSIKVLALAGSDFGMQLLLPMHG